MKRTIGIVVGLATLGTAVYLGSQLWAQQPAAGGVRPASAAAPAGPSGAKTRVAVFNLKFVVTNYWKWHTMQADYKKAMEGFEGKILPLKNEFDKFAKQMQDGKFTDQAFPTREAVEKQLRKLKSQMEEIQEEAKSKAADMQTQMMMTIYNEVVATVNRYAMAHDLDLVMHYNDGVDKIEMNAKENVYRKINTGACTPVYWKGEVDISADLVATLKATAPPGYVPPAQPAAAPGTTQPRPPQ